MTYFTFDVRFARTILDPAFQHRGLKRHIFVVPIKNLPIGLPTDPNARTQNTRTRVAKIIKDSLFNRECEPSTFHLKSNGISIIAERVQKHKDDEDRYRVQVLNGQGIIDGGHTYRIITDSLEDEELPDDQFVNVEILTGIDSEWIPDIAGGRNTTVQVAPMSLDNLGGHFEWMKEEIEGESYANEIAWSENDDGEFDARDLIALLSLFDVAYYPNDGDSYPISAYSRKSRELTRFEDNPEPFKSMRPILRDVLNLHDIIRHDYYSIWNNQGQSGGSRAGGLSISQKKKNGKWKFAFTGEEAEFRMVNGALYPMLGAFRWFVKKDPNTGVVLWRDGFEAVLDAWEQCSLPLLKATYDMSKELGHRPNAIGKSTAHWRSLHQLVAMWDYKKHSS